MCANRGAGPRRRRHQSHMRSGRFQGNARAQRQRSGTSRGADRRRGANPAPRWHISLPAPVSDDAVCLFHPNGAFHQIDSIPCRPACGVAAIRVAAIVGGGPMEETSAAAHRSLVGPAGDGGSGEPAAAARTPCSGEGPRAAGRGGTSARRAAAGGPRGRGGPARRGPAARRRARRRLGRRLRGRATGSELRIVEERDRELARVRDEAERRISSGLTQSADQIETLAGWVVSQVRGPAAGETGS